MSVVSSTRSAASAARVSTKRRYHCASRSTGTPSLVSGPTGKFGARPRVSFATDDETVHECERAVVPIEVGEEVGHRDERGEPGAPAGIAVARAELDAGPHDLARLDARVEQPEHRLGDDERDVLLEPLAQPALEVRDHVGVRAGADEHVVAADLDVEAARVVGPEVERAARRRGRSGRGASGR